MKLINDPVHGMVSVPEFAIPVISTPLFQRLNRVKQTGSLYKAWPSSVHTRFQHSVGTMHLALEYSKILKLSETETKLFALASLLHDIAHGPFSHSFETAFKSLNIPGTSFNHDTFRVELLLHNQELKQSVCGLENDIIDVWDGKNSLMYDLLAGVAGVDRMDYVIRDMYHLAPQSRLDRTCVQSIMYETQITNGKVEYSDKAVKFISNLLIARCYMYSEVYAHRRSVAGDYVLQKAISNMTNDIINLVNPYNFERVDDGYIESYAWKNHPSSKYMLMYLRNSEPEMVRCDQNDDNVVINYCKVGLSEDECGKELYERLCDKSCNNICDMNFFYKFK